MAGLKCARAGLVALCVFLCGCPAGVDLDGGGSIFGSANDAVGDAPASDDQQTAVDATVAGQSSSQLRGEVSEYGDYRLFDVGGASAGEQISVAVNDPFSTISPFLVAIFDEAGDLVMRGVVAAGQPVTHAVRASAANFTVGVTPLSNSTGGAFNLRADRRGGVEAPGAAGQIVYLNFQGASGLSVHGRPGVSFGAFDARDISSRYLGLTPTVRTEIVNVIRADYAPYQVTIVSSDEGPPPAEAHSTIHFGADDNDLLGLADNVDLYNADSQQAAIIYTDAFATYEIMELSAEEMGLMIGNVASHELGHLLGLYHTKNPTDVMDTTGSAWDLAGSQSFERAELEPSVFPYGHENSPRLLEQTVGRRPDFVESSRPTAASSTKVERAMRVRQAAQLSLRGRCGTCLHLDD